MVTKKQLTIGAIITLLLAVSGTYFIADNDEAYYCESRDMVMICEKLSSGIGTRCYYENTYKNCKEGWIKIEIGQLVEYEEPTPQDVPAPAGGTKYLCSPEECIKIS